MPSSASTQLRIAQAPDADIVIAIVNYRTPDLVVDCLRSLASEIKRTPSMEAVVADNASGDGSAARIAQAIEENGWSSWASVVVLPVNGGFAYGNNAIIREAIERKQRPRFVWLLNSDTVVRPGACQMLVDYLDRNPSVDIAGSRMEYPDGEPQRSAFRFHSIAGEFEAAARVGPISRSLDRWVVAPPASAVPVPCDWVAGASMMIRSSVFDRIGMLDDAYFLYYEEADFCLRAARAGSVCHYVPASRVVHLIGASTGVTNTSSRAKRRPAYWFEARQRYYRKNHGALYSMLADLALLSGMMIWTTRCLVERRQLDQPERFALDIIRHSALFAR